MIVKGGLFGMRNPGRGRGKGDDDGVNIIDVHYICTK
jgi:hypothetical protein